MPAASSVAPKDAAGYLSLDANLGDAQWKQAVALLGRFPSAQKAQQALDQVRAARSAFGDRVDLVWLDFANNGRDVVAITKPKDPQALSSLLRNASNPPVSTVVDGWTVIARDQATLSAFEQHRSESGGGLGGDSTFKDAFRDLPTDALVQGFVRGSTLQAALTQAITKQVTTPGLTPSVSFGKLDSLGAAVVPEPGGLRLEASATGDFKTNPITFHPELPLELPAGAVVYVSFSNLEDSLRNALDRVGQFVPNFDQVRAQLEAQLGFSLDKDLLPLFGGEGAVVVYPQPQPQVPAFDFVLKVSDEAAAHRVVDRLTALGEQSGGGRVATTQIAGVKATKISTNSLVLYVAVFGGKLVVTDSSAAIEALQGTGSKLADDPVYTAAVAGAQLPGETSGFLYANLQSGVPYALKWFANRTQQTVSPQTLENVKPLKSVLVYTSKHGDTFTFTGFLGIE